MRQAVYPGTFDPITNGHLDIIERGAHIFRHLTVAVARNERKRPLIHFEQRIEMIRKCTAHVPNVTVEGFSNLLIDYLAQKDIKHVIRGLRAISDFEYELQLALMNRQLSPDVETLFLMPRQEYIFLSSNIVREIGQMGGDYRNFVPVSVFDDIDKHFTRPTL